MREKRGFGRSSSGGSGGFSRGGSGGGFRKDNFGDQPKPVKVGEEYNVKISDVGSKGDGITKIENFIVFVPGGKKGEETRIRIKEVSSRFAVGEKVGAAEASEQSSSSDEETEETEETEEVSEEEE